MAAYGPGANNTWTQGYNTYDGNCAYTGSTPCGDPHCDTPSGYNCQQWPYGSESEGGYFHGTWLQDFSSSANFHTAVGQAVNDASNQPYYSPSFQERSASSGYSCSTVSVCMTSAHLGNSGRGEQLCAYTNLYGNPANYAVITFNVDVSWFIGNPGSSAGDCSVNAIAHHEMGHVLGLGHSSDPGSLMWWAPNAVNFGADEAAGLKAIYLNNYQPRQAGGGDTCNSCQAACENVMSKMPPTAFIITSSCGAAALPLPTVTYPTIAPQQLIQKPVGAVDNEVATVKGIIQK